jgi:beta-aspartyl-peptidase (threonine type)
MDIFRTFVIAAAMTLSTDVLFADSTDEADWSYDSKTATMAAPTTPDRALAREVASYEIAQFAAWNRHDLRAFLSAYWNNAQLVSVSNGEELIGYSALATQLVQAFGKDPTSMGHVDLDRLRIKMVSNDTACCMGTYRVRTSNHIDYCEDTEILKRFPDGWRIVLENSTIHAN